MSCCTGLIDPCIGYDRGLFQHGLDESTAAWDKIVREFFSDQTG